MYQRVAVVDVVFLFACLCERDVFKRSWTKKGRAAERSSGGRVEMGDGDPSTAFIAPIYIV